MADANGSTLKASLMDLSCLPRLSESHPRTADGSLGRFLNLWFPRFMVGRTRLSRCAAYLTHGQRYASVGQPRSEHRDTSRTRETAARFTTH